MVARDTTIETARSQAAVYQQMRPEERIRIAFEMSDFTRELAMAGLRSRKPQLTDTELQRELTWLLYGQGPRA